MSKEKRGLLRKQVSIEQIKKNNEGISITLPNKLRHLGILLLFSFTLFISLILMIDYERKTTAPGLIVSSTGPINIHSSNNEGTIDRRFVNNGETVKKGDKLLTIKTQRTSAFNDDVEESIINSLQQSKKNLSNRLNALSKLHELKLKSLKSKREVLLIQEELAQNRIKLLKKENSSSKLNIIRLRKLLKKNHIPKQEFFDQEKQHNETALRYQLSLENLANIQSELVTNQMDIKQLPLAINNESTELLYRISEINKEIVNTEANKSYTLYAPDDGVVIGLKTKLNTAVKPNERLITLSPHNDILEVDLYVSMENAGFIEVGQEVNIRYKPFPFQRFGKFKGRVKEIASSSLAPTELPLTIQSFISNPVYRVTASINKQYIKAYGKTSKLLPGMMLEADIVIEKISFFDLVFDPIYQIKGKLQ